MQAAGHHPAGREKESNSTDYSHPLAATCEILPSPFSHWGTLNAGGLSEKSDKFVNMLISSNVYKICMHVLISSKSWTTGKEVNEYISLAAP